MGTEKRERKKTNREIGRQVQQQQARREKTIKSTVRITGAVVVVIAIFFAIAFLTDSDDESVSPTESAVPTSPTPGEVPPETAPAEPVDFVYGTGECAPEDGSGEQKRTFDDAPALCIDLTKTYTAVVKTNFGEYTMVLDAIKAPGTVNNFVNLARFQYFDGITCHRAIPGFMVQCGDPTGTGSGGPGYSFADELPAAGEYEIGSVAMANAGPNTNGSQFFVITGDQGITLQPNYTLFGTVTEGLDTTVVALDAAGNPNDNGVPPLQEIIIESVTITVS